MYHRRRTGLFWKGVHGVGRDGCWAVASIDNDNCGNRSGSGGDSCSGSGGNGGNTNLTWVIGCAIWFGLPMTCTMRNHANCRVALWIVICNGSVISTLRSGHITSQHRCRIATAAECRKTPPCEYEAFQEVLRWLPPGFGGKVGAGSPKRLTDVLLTPGVTDNLRPAIVGGMIAAVALSLSWFFESHCLRCMSSIC